MASTAIHTIEPKTAIRSFTPSQGVCSFVSTLGASMAVKAPKTRTARIVAISRDEPLSKRRSPDGDHEYEEECVHPCEY